MDTEQEHEPWTRYVGVQDKVYSFTGLTRGLGRKATGLNALELMDWMVDSEDFSKDPKLADLKRKIELWTDTKFLIPIGALGSGRNIEDAIFLEDVDSANREKFENAVYNLALWLTEVPNTYERVYWQLDNEINSKSYCNTVTLEEVSNQNYVGSIEYYVKMVAAPAVHALRQVAFEKRGNPERTNIVLGSLGNAFKLRHENPDNELRVFLNELMEAPVDYKSTQGKLKDFMDVISLHYLLSQDNRVPEAFTEVFEKYAWNMETKVTGLWATEEGGKKRGRLNLSGMNTVKVLSRILSYVSNYDLSSHEMCFNVYGSRSSEKHCRAEHVLEYLYGYLGHSRLKCLEEFEDEHFEWRSFVSLDSPYQVIFGNTKGDPEEGPDELLEVPLEVPKGYNRVEMTMLNSHGTNPVLTQREGDCLYPVECQIDGRTSWVIVMGGDWW